MKVLIVLCLFAVVSYVAAKKTPTTAKATAKPTTVKTTTTKPTTAKPTTTKPTAPPPCNVLNVMEQVNGGSKKIWDQLWNDKAQAIAEKAFETSFIQKLTEGALDPSLYGSFVINDFYFTSRGPQIYLMTYNKEVNKSEATEEHKNTLLEYLEHENTSYPVYNEIAYRQWLIDPDYAQLFVKPLEGSKIKEYSEFIENTAKELDPFYTVVANAPCHYLWGWLGEKMLNAVPAKNLYNIPGQSVIKNTFGDHPDTRGNKMMINVINKVGVSYDLLTMQDIFMKAMAYELANFEAITHIYASTS